MILSSQATQTAPQLGARAPHRQALRQPLSQPLVTRPLTAPTPAVVPVLTPPTPQDAAWRSRAIALAWANDWQSQATYSGHSARGLDYYAVPSSRHGHATYRVTFTPDPHAITIHDGRYVCTCQAASHDRPCRHAGAALILAQLRAEVRESVALADRERMGWAHATHHGWMEARHIAIFQVGAMVAGFWRYLDIWWDTTRDVAIWCDCGERICAHIGVVALRVAKEQADALRRRQHGYDPDWLNALDPLWDGAVLPAPLV